MKYINKILSLFVIALIATSCDPDAESYTLGELVDGCHYLGGQRSASALAAH